jgi:hypothetical protein
MVPAQGAWNAELKRAAGTRARARARRMKQAHQILPQADRKKVLAAALARKKRA